MMSDGNVELDTGSALGNVPRMNIGAVHESRNQFAVRLYYIIAESQRGLRTS
jgi:hypothetical protein